MLFSPSFYTCWIVSFPFLPFSFLFLYCLLICIHVGLFLTHPSHSFIFSFLFSIFLYVLDCLFYHPSHSFLLLFNHLYTLDCFFSYPSPFFFPPFFNNYLYTCSFCYLLSLPCILSPKEFLSVSSASQSVAAAWMTHHSRGGSVIAGRCVPGRVGSHACVAAVVPETIILVHLHY